MPYAERLITSARDAAGFKTYAELAAALGVEKATLSQWKNGRGSPIPDDRIIELCRMAGITDVGPWLVAAQADAARSQAVRTALESVLDRLRPALAGVGLLVVGLAGSSLPSPAQARVEPELNSGPVMHYAKWLLRRLRAAMTRNRARWTHGTPAVLA